MTYRLQTDGDALEQRVWDQFVKDYFPNYESFWINFVAPRTNRPVNIMAKDNIPFDERRIMMLQYTILNHLSFVFENFSSSSNRDNFENCYLRLSSAIDAAEEFLACFLVWKNKTSFENIIENIDLGNPTPTKENAIKSLEKGKNYSIPIINKKEIILELCSKKFIAKFNSFVKKSNLIKNYRNIIAHSWLLYQIDTMFPRKETINNYSFRDWANIVEELSKTGKKNELLEKYKNMETMVREDFSEILYEINEMWEYIINL
ncbi:MAG TPA: hypothetical protein VMW72_25130 [Sedimentisphaerales bacterium]|nr:hypothetical protein [Sedimentisphaerales bacterium]